LPIRNRRYSRLKTCATRSNADCTREGDKDFISSASIFDSILKRDREDPAGLNGFLRLFHIGSGPGRADKFHTRFGELLDNLEGRGYRFVRIDELLGRPDIAAPHLTNTPSAPQFPGVL
jgi:hypothetical protein